MQKKSSLNNLDEFHGLLLKIFRKYPMILNDIFVKNAEQLSWKVQKLSKGNFFQSEYIFVLHVLLGINCYKSVFNHSLTSTGKSCFQVLSTF